MLRLCLFSSSWERLQPPSVNPSVEQNVIEDGWMDFDQEVLVHLLRYFHVYVSFQQHSGKKSTNYFCVGLFPLKAQAGQQLRRPQRQFSRSILRLIRLLNRKCDGDSYCQSQEGQQTDNPRRIAPRARAGGVTYLSGRGLKERPHLGSLPLDRRCVRDRASDRL